MTTILLTHERLLVFNLERRNGLPAVFCLRLDYGDGSMIRLGCGYSLISQALLNIERHVIHQMKAEYYSYRLV